MSDPSGSSVPKAIGSLAKKQSDVTRQGTQKLKFVPTLPQRRKKEDVTVKQEPVASDSSVPPKPARGRGRGDTRGTPRGRGRGAPPVIEMSASGPFAMGPSQAGRSTTRPVPPSTLASVDSVNPSRLDIGLSQVIPPSLVKEGKRGQIKVSDEEVYSDPDDGVEIVDMDQVKKIDWMAPDILRKERRTSSAKMKQEDTGNIPALDAASGQALTLSESEDEELEDVIESFTTRANVNAEECLDEEQLYLFQFPSPFPTFIKKKDNIMDVDQRQSGTEKRVTFAPDVKSDASPSTSLPEAAEPKLSERVSGPIGQLEVYRSGSVRMRLTNDILLDVNASTQPSFLQQVVYLNKTEKQLVVLGEVNKQLVVSPNVEALLSAVNEVTKESVFQDKNLSKME